MPLALLGLLNNPLVRYGLLALAVVAVCFAAIKHYEAVGARRAQEAQHAADMAWLATAQGEAKANKDAFTALAAQLDHLEKTRVAKQIVIAQKSAASDSRGCLDGDAADRLLGLGADDRSVQDAHRKRGRAAAGSANR